MKHFIVLVNLYDNSAPRMVAFEQRVLELFPKSYQERDEGVFLISTEKGASEVVRDLDDGDFSLSDFFLVLEIGNTAAQGMTSTTFYEELKKRLAGRSCPSDEN